MATLAAGVIAPALQGTRAPNWRVDGVRFESTSNGEGDIIVLHDAVNVTLDRILIVAGPNGQKRDIRAGGTGHRATQPARGRDADGVPARQRRRSKTNWLQPRPTPPHCMLISVNPRSR
jgi:hypothetical protein